MERSATTGLIWFAACHAALRGNTEGWNIQARNIAVHVSSDQ
jgi:hypothetical protein